MPAFLLPYCLYSSMAQRPFSTIARAFRITILTLIQFPWHRRALCCRTNMFGWIYFALMMLFSSSGSLFNLPPEYSETFIRASSMSLFPTRTFFCLMFHSVRCSEGGFTYMLYKLQPLCPIVYREEKWQWLGAAHFFFPIKDIHLLSFLYLLTMWFFGNHLELLRGGSSGKQTLFSPLLNEWLNLRDMWMPFASMFTSFSYCWVIEINKIQWVDT